MRRIFIAGPAVVLVTGAELVRQRHERLKRKRQTEHDNAFLDWLDAQDLEGENDEV